MAWPSIVPPVAGSVITVAREVAMNNDPLNWLRLLTGNADPPAAHYVVVSTGAASTAWAKISSDELGPGVAVGNLGFTPVNKAGDTMTASLTLTNTGAGGPVSDGVLYLGSTGGVAYLAKLGDAIVLAGRPFFVTGGNLTVNAGNLNVTAGGVNVTAGNVVVTGDIFAARAGPSASSGVLFLGNGGHFLAYDGTRFVLDGNVAWHAGNDGAGSGLEADTVRGFRPENANGPFFLAVNNGLVNEGVMRRAENVAGFTPNNANGPFFLAVNNGTINEGVMRRAENVGGRTPTSTPTADAIPIADASGKLDAWVTPTAAAPVPSGLIAFIPDASLPAGWTFYTPANGRVIVAAGTASVTNPQAFAAGTNYGGDWAHAHIGNSFGVTTSVSVTGSAVGGPEDNTGGPSAVNGLAAAGGVNLPTDIHTHSLNGVSFAMSGTGSGSGTATGNTVGAIWVPPSHALNAIRKS